MIKRFRLPPFGGRNASWSAALRRSRSLQSPVRTAGGLLPRLATPAAIRAALLPRAVTGTGNTTASAVVAAGPAPVIVAHGRSARARRVAVSLSALGTAAAVVRAAPGVGNPSEGSPLTVPRRAFGPGPAAPAPTPGEETATVVRIAGQRVAAGPGRVRAAATAVSAATPGGRPVVRVSSGAVRVMTPRRAGRVAGAAARGIAHPARVPRARRVLPPARPPLGAGRMVTGQGNGRWTFPSTTPARYLSSSPVIGSALLIFKLPFPRVGTGCSVVSAVGPLRSVRMLTGPGRRPGVMGTLGLRTR